MNLVDRAAMSFGGCAGDLTRTGSQMKGVSCSPTTCGVFPSFGSLGGVAFWSPPAASRRHQGLPELVAQQQVMQQGKPKHNRSDLFQPSHRKLAQSPIAEHGIHPFHGAGALLVDRLGLF